jgi:hypothetical protein
MSDLEDDNNNLQAKKGNSIFYIFILQEKDVELKTSCRPQFLDFYFHLIYDTIFVFK